MSINDYVRWFSDIRASDVALVGGKNASLGELYSTLSRQGVRVPNGFALTADAYRAALTAAKAWERLHQLLDNLDKRDVEALAKRAAEAREIVYQATATGPLRKQIDRAYRQLEIGARGERGRCRSKLRYRRGSPVGELCRPAREFSERQRHGRSVRSLPSLLCIHFHRSRDLLSRRQRIRPFQGLALGRRDEDGAVGSRRKRRDFHIGHRIRFPRRRVCYRRLRARRKHRAGDGRSRRVLRPQADLSRGSPDCLEPVARTQAVAHDLCRPWRRHEKCADPRGGARALLHYGCRGAQARRRRDHDRRSLFESGRPSDAHGYRMGQGW